MLPTDSYLARWFRDHRKHFPDSGFPGEIYVGEVDYSMQQLQKLDFIVSGMERFADEGEFVVEADFWWSKLRHFLQGRGCARHSPNGFLNMTQEEVAPTGQKTVATLTNLKEKNVDMQSK